MTEMLASKILPNKNPTGIKSVRKQTLTQENKKSLGPPR
jgi:hypothetical protein